MDHQDTSLCDLSLEPGTRVDVLARLSLPLPYLKAQGLSIHCAAGKEVWKRWEPSLNRNRKGKCCMSGMMNKKFYLLVWFWEIESHGAQVRLRLTIWLGMALVPPHAFASTS